MSTALIATSVHAGESAHDQSANDQSRAGIEALSREMSTCAAYFSLLSSIIEDANGPAAKAEMAQRIRTTGEAMLLQSIKVANLIGVAEHVVTERVQAALQEMVNAVNANPASSLAAMYTKYGQPCDELLQNAPSRLADLIARDGPEF
jgi:hypothetical protein